MDMVSTSQYLACDGVLAGGESGRSPSGTVCTRRDLLLTSLLAALPLGARSAAATPLNPAQTIIKLLDALQWETQPLLPQGSADICPLTGDSTAPGFYFMLIRWHPGYMSAPHTYTTDRSCVVVSGAWWVNSGADFDPASCVSASAGSFLSPNSGDPRGERR